MTASRKVFRADLKTELAPLMPSVPSGNFFQYEPATYNGVSPIVFLRSDGSEHEEITKATNSDFFIQVHILTLYGDVQGGTYNEEDATDLLDDVEQELSAAVETKRVVRDKWQKLFFVNRSTVDPQPVGGELYLHEVITLQGRMY
jgi:hypothetical protein